MRHFLSVVAFFMVLTSASAQSLPDYSELYVNDFADLLPQEDEDSIRSKLRELREKRGIEFTVVTIGAMSDYGHFGEFEPFATELFNYWGVGDATRNDGVMMLVARFDRLIRIELGSGYGLAKNAPMQAIIDDVILPRFRKDEYAMGIIDGVDAVIHDLTGDWPGEYDATSVEKAWGAVKRLVRAFGDWIYVMIAPLLLFPVQLYRRWRRNHPRICPRDGSRMTRLDENWDDAHLKDGQVTEEQLKSVDYDVWECPVCDHKTIEAYRAWFTSYGACRSCGYRTVEADSTIERHATTSSEGLRRIDYHCQNCNDQWTGYRNIPRKSESSSSSGSSFGGGSSSGGGASGSW